MLLDQVIKVSGLAGWAGLAGSGWLVNASMAVAVVKVIREEKDESDRASRMLREQSHRASAASGDLDHSVCAQSKFMGTQLLSCSAGTSKPAPTLATPAQACSAPSTHWSSAARTKRARYASLRGADGTAMLSGGAPGSAYTRDIPWSPARLRTGRCRG